MKNRLFFAIFLVAYIFSVSYSYEYLLKPIDDSIAPGETALYNVTINNTANETTKYTIFMLSSFSYSISNETIILNASEDATLLLKIYTYNNTNLGTYKNPLSINTKDGTKSIDIVTVVQLPLSQYFRVSGASISSSLTPRDQLSVNVTIANDNIGRNAIVDVSLYKGGFNVTSFRNATQIEIGEKTKTFAFNLNPLLPAGGYVAKISVNLLGEEIYSSLFDVNILPYSKPEVIREEKKSIFGKEVAIGVVNNGTEVLSSYILSEDISMLDKLLILSRNDGYLSNGKLNWEIKDLESSRLEEGIPIYSMATRSYSITYVPLLLVPFVISAIILIIIFLNRKVTVTKSISHYRMANGELDIQFRITVKNVTLHKLTDIRIIEQLPAYIKSVHEFGHLKPEYEDQKLKWRIDNLRPKEEIMVSYKVKGRIEIIGNLFFPPSRVYFKDKDSVYLRASNTVGVRTKSETMG